MPGYIEDRWYTKKPDPVTGQRRATTLHGKGKRYKVTGIPGVRARSFPDGKLGEARKWLAKAQAESEKGEFYDPRDGQILLREYVENYWWPSLSADPATLESIHGRVRNHILPHLGELPLRQIKVATLRTWLKGLEGAIAPGTALAVWGYLSNILAYAVDDGRISKNPCKARTIKAPKPPEQLARAWTRTRVLAVQAALPERFRILVDVAVGCGHRQGEAFAIDVDQDIDREAGVIHVRRQIKRVAGKLVFAPPKTDKVRTVPAPRYLVERIDAHLEQFPAIEVTLPWKDPRPPETRVEAKERAPRTHRLLVTSTEGGAIRAWSFNQHFWKKALAAAGVIPPPPEKPKGRGRQLQYGDTREHGFHCLRHTFASVQLDARESVVSVSKWLGHADAAITLRVYAHFMPEADGRGRRAMDAWFSSLQPSQEDRFQKISLDSPYDLKPSGSAVPLKVTKPFANGSSPAAANAVNGVPR